MGSPKCFETSAQAERQTNLLLAGENHQSNLRFEKDGRVNTENEVFPLLVRRHAHSIDKLH
jgi:hypothetical protein